MNKNPGAPVNRVSLYDVTIDRKSIISYNKLYPNQKLKKFIETVRSIAVPGFNELMLKEYIDVLNFRKLIITYARYKNEIIGFSAVVIQEKKTTRGKSFFVCKGFPAISIEYRTATQKDPEVESLFFKLFQKMTKHLIQFYIKNEEPIKNFFQMALIY